MSALNNSLSQQQSIEIDGRNVVINFSKAASKALAQRTTPLLVEMELYFSCLIRKKVRFRDAAVTETTTGTTTGSDTLNNAVTLNEYLQVCFRPVMTRICGKDYEGDEPPLTDFPIAKPQPYVPHWLHIDFRKNQWQGEFGYDPAK